MHANLGFQGPCKLFPKSAGHLHYSGILPRGSGDMGVQGGWGVGRMPAVRVLQKARSCRRMKCKHLLLSDGVELFGVEQQPIHVKQDMGDESLLPTGG
jgi:hypothetical protein